MKCAQCDKEFEPAVPYQKYCSAECRQVYYRTHDDLPEREPFEFFCKHCGKYIVTATHGDRRSVFCSRKCEKKYWKHSLRHSKRENNGMSGGMSLSSLIWREKRALD